MKEYSVWKIIRDRPGCVDFCGTVYAEDLPSAEAIARLMYPVSSGDYLDVEEHSNVANRVLALCGEPPVPPAYPSDCPDCGCDLMRHNAVNAVSDGSVAHCGKCGACWKSLNTPFVERLTKELTGEA
jgi:hypothetical protein